MLLKQLRLESGSTQQELSSILNISKSTCGSWEREETQPTLEQLVQIANYFEVTTDYLLGRSNDVGLIEVKQELPTATKQLVAIFDRFNDLGKGALLGYAQSLLDNKLYVIG